MVKIDEGTSPETYFPLKVYVCDKCWLVQVDELQKAEAIFNSEYTYFSSFSTSWLKHAENYVNYMTERFNLGSDSKVIEVASNDGYLLQYFLKRNIPVLGVEPTENTANVAIGKGINCIIDFFGEELAKSKINGTADLLLGNNVLAHVPDINDFVKGVKIALKPSGIATFEFPHLCKLIELSQFDTIYHEHFSYLSLTAVKTIFELYDLEIFDVQELTTHGGSLRVFVKHCKDESKVIESSVYKLLENEELLGVKYLSYYTSFQKKVDSIKYSFIEWLINQKKQNKRVIGYGAAAKGNTLLNYCGIKGTDLIQFVVDRSPYKQKKLLPGSRIPVYDESRINEYKPDYIIIFPWNLQKEIYEQLRYVESFGCKLIVFVPETVILSS
jgi:2-polyprenyl-3-methyl-5-hydroxy-6-metoxy-1,4-benzoquinol methylase